MASEPAGLDVRRAIPNVRDRRLAAPHLPFPPGGGEDAGYLAEDGDADHGNMAMALSAAGEMPVAADPPHSALDDAALCRAC